jgi:uncharacterized protein involved in outer membrane biogenesis
MRRVFRILVILGIVTTVAVLGARWYLSSAHVAHQAAEQLSEMYGGRVEVDHADIGFKSSTLRGVHLYEVDSSSGQAPWMTLGSVHADVSLWELINGTGTPRHLDVRDAKVLLRFDRNGKLLTRLPSGEKSGTTGKATSELPAINLERSQITLAREGEQPLVIDEVKARLLPEGDKLVLSGEGSSPHWGKLTLSGNVNPRADAADIRLKTAGTVHVTQPMLAALPYIPESVWKDVQVEGDTPVDLKVTYDPGANKVHYRADLEAKHTQVVVPAAALHGNDASGKITVEDNVVRLRDIRGQAYRGTLAGDADLDFRGEATQLDFIPIDAHDLDVRLLPESWGLPRELEGRLNLSGNVYVTLDHGKISTAGNARAQIVNARIAGQPVDGPIDLELAPEGPPLGNGVTVAPVDERAQDPKAPPGPPRLQRPTYLTIKLNLKDADLGQMVEKLKLNLPFTVQGRLNFHGQAAIPMSGQKETKDYRFTGSLLITNAAFADAHLEKIEAEATFQNGLLKLDKLYGVAPGAPVPDGKPTPGTFQGTLRAQVDPPGDLTGNLRLDRLPLGQAAKELGVKDQVNGEITGAVSAKMSLARLQKDKRWDGNGELTVKHARAFGWTLENAVADVKLKGKTLTLADLHGRLEGTDIVGSGEMGLDEPYPYKVRVEVIDADLAAVERLTKDVKPAVELAGRATVTANLHGTVEPFRVESSGTAAVTGLQIDHVKFRQVKTAWDSTPDQLKVKDFKAQLYGGEVTGTAVVPLDEKAGGNVDLAMKDIDVGQMLKEAEIGLPIEGKAAGTVKGTLTPAPPGKERPVNLTLDLKAPQLKVQGIEADALHGTVRYQGEDISYQFEAKTLGGTIDVEGKVPRQAPGPGEELGTGKLRAQGLRLDHLGPLLGPRHRRFPLSGRVDAHVDYRFEGPERTPVGAGRVVLTDLAWNGHDWLERTQAQVLLERDRLLVRNLNATLAQGSLRGRLSLSWKHPRLNWYEVSLNRVDAGELLSAWPSVRQHIEGPLDANIRGRFGKELSGHGIVLLPRGKVYGISVMDWRMPFQAVYVPKQGRGRVRVTAASATMALGQVTGEVTYAWGEMHELRGKMRFRNMDTRHLLRAAAETAHLGGGKVSGTADFSGPGFVGLDQMSATVDASFSQAQALQWPVLSALAPFLRLGSSSSFQSGQIRGHLGGGVFRIERLSLKGGPANLYATGTVTTAGRLGLAVHAGAPQVGSKSPGLRSLAMRTPVVGAMPTSLLSRASSLLSGQLIHARVTGTVRSPTVQIMPLRSLQEDVVRFFLPERGGR